MNRPPQAREGLTTRKARPSLPPQPTPFIGRAEEVAEITELLADTGCRLLTLVGPGGIGKTRLAIQVAAERAVAFANGVCFVPLSSVYSTNHLVSTVADALNIPLAGREIPSQQLLSYLQDKEMLLLLDNFEQLLAPPDGRTQGRVAPEEETSHPTTSEGGIIGTVDFLINILQSAPGTKLIVTSREVLNLQEEWLYHVRGLLYPEGALPNHFENYGAVQLFGQRARRVRRDFSLADEGPDVVRICQLVDGMPLAIELAASWTKTLNCSAIANEIQDNLDFLSTSLRNVPERHRSMRAALDYSWKYLTSQEQAVFKRLSVFRGGFRRAAAQQVADTTLPILSALVDKSLLRWEPGGRYQIHELVRQYSQERLEQTPVEAERIRDLHCAYYTDFLYQHAGDIQAGEHKEISADIENIRLAWHRAVEKANLEAIYKSASTLQFFFDIQGHYLEGATSFEAAAQRLDGLDRDIETDLTLADVLVQLGWSCIRLGHLEKAGAALERSRAIYNELNAPPPLRFATDPMPALGVLANIYGDYTQATRLGEEARRLSEARDDDQNLQLAFYVLANAAFSQGQYESAHDFAVRSLAAAKAAGNRWFMAYVLSDLGNVARALGDYAEAREHYQTSYDIRSEFDDPEGMAVSLNHLAKIAWLQADYRESETLYHQSYAIYREINDRGGLATSLRGLGDTARVLGDDQVARQYYHQALQITVDMQFLPLTLAILAGIGELLLGVGQPERGVELLAFVSNHSASDQETKARVQQSLDRCQTSLSPELFAAAVQRGEAGDLDTMVTTLQTDLATPFDAAERTAPSFPSPPDASALVEPLTPRELEVLQLIAQGMTNQQIAEELVISVGTVKFYTAQIYGKIGVHNRTQAVARGRELELLP